MSGERPTVIERAFMLAESGASASVSALKDQLKAEGYSDDGQLRGRAITNQLRGIIAAKVRLKVAG